MRTIMISRSSWNKIWTVFNDNPSFVATPDNIGSTLPDLGSGDMAKKIIGSLKVLGILGENNNKLTTLGRKWASSSTYPSACKEIIHNAYPKGVESFTSKNPFPRDEVIKWLISTGGMNEAGAEKNTGFLSWLCESAAGNVPEATPAALSFEPPQIPAQGIVSVTIPANLPPAQLTVVLSALNNSLNASSLNISFI